MKTNFKKLFLLAIILFAPGGVKAASLCSYSEQVELNDIVANVKASYEIVDEYAGKVLDVDSTDENGNTPERDSYVKSIVLSIMNITDDIYVKLVSDEGTTTFKYSDTDNGVATYKVNDIEKLNKYTIEVYSNKYGCAGELFRKFDYQTPVYNYLSEWPGCVSNPDFYYCQQFINTETISFSSFKAQLDEYVANKKNEEQEATQEEEKNLWGKIKEFYSKNAIWINSVLVVIVITGVATTVILIKKKRSRVL